MPERILIVDDEAGVRRPLCRHLEERGYQVSEASDGAAAIRILQSAVFGLVIMDIRMPGMDGLEALARIKQIDPRLPVIIITAHGTTETAIEATKRGAFEYYLKPFERHQLIQSAEHALKCVRLMRQPVPTASDAAGIEGDSIVGSSPVMLELFKTIGRVAPTDATVLIRGETGTGKELVARAIYQHSLRRQLPLLIVDCGAISETLLESELFGHEKGAFTDAIACRIGKFEQARGATLFLDEIGNSSLAVQARLLRALQEKTIERVGGNETIRVDARILAATNRNLEEAVAAGRFRQDLYYRLMVATIDSPPLRERRDDIPRLVDYFLERQARKLQLKKPTLSAEALQVLQEHSWPGNVRELEHGLARASVFCRGYVLEAGHVLSALEAASDLSTAASSDEQRLRAIAQHYLAAHSGETAYAQFLDLVEKVLVLEALKLGEGNQTRAARLLGLSRSTFLTKMRRFASRGR